MENGGPHTDGSLSCVSKDSEAEILAKDMKELTISPSAKKPVRPVRQRRRRHRISTKIIKPVENKSEAILRKVQSAFPRRQVRTLLSVQNDPIARMKRFIRVSCICGQGYYIR